VKILFYDDSAVYGGHEVMTLLGLKALLETGSTEVEFWAAEANETLHAKLLEIQQLHPELKVVALPWCSSKLEGLRHLIKPGRITDLAAMLQTARPDLILAVQGNIEHSSLSLLAGKKAGIRTASYIPVPHSNAEMGAKLGSLRDLFTPRLFRTPDHFITITDQLAVMLRERGAVCPIHVVYNGVDTRRFQSADREGSRTGLNLPQNALILGMVGRIEFKQKQQHLLAEAAQLLHMSGKPLHLVYAGDGPDADALKEMLKAAKLSHTVLPWCDPAMLYPALDALIIPSRYEGLPLVMLEALACGTTVLASDRDGMKDVLPSDCRFTPGDPQALARTIQHFLSQYCPPPSEALVNRVREKMSLEAFAKNFTECLIRLAAPKSD
jgi:glycosyltransferase involved in cell wall biosynthesis